MPKPNDFSDTNAAGQKYKKPKKKAPKKSKSRKPASDGRERDSSPDRLSSKDIDKIRSDLSGYRKRVLQAPGRAVGMRDD